MPDLSPDRALRSPPPPGARQAVQRAGRRRRAAAAGALVTLLALPVLALGLPRLAERDTLVASPAPVAEPCPQQLPVTTDREPSVVPPPSSGPAGRLVPAEVPRAALVCRYEDSSIFTRSGNRSRPTSVALAGQRALAAGLERIASDLALPAGSAYGFCTQAGGPTVPHLLRLDYASESVWVSTSTDVNGCALVTNGAFTAPVYVGGQVAASFDAGAWVDPPLREGFADPCRLSKAGRAGQETALVPDGWTGLDVCVDGAPRPVAPERAAAVADLLGGLELGAGGAGSSCPPPAGPPDAGTPRQLVWRYPSGRDVLTFLVLGCDPPVDSLLLSATATLEEQAELARLLRKD